MTTSENPVEPSPPVKPSRFASGIRWLGIFIAVFLTLIVSLALFLTYLFPSEFVRKELEVRGSALLQGSLRIQTLSFNLLTGLELTHVTFTKAEHPLLQFNRLNLDYSLLGLFQRQLQINEIRIVGADVMIDLEKMKGGPAEPIQEPAPKVSPEHPALPLIPVSLDLEALIISRSNVHVEVTPAFTVNLRDINLDISGGVSQEAASLAGMLTIADIAVDLEHKKIHLPLEIAFQLSADLQKQALDLQQLTVQMKPALQLTLSGRVDEWLSTTALDVSLRNVAIHLDQLLTVGKDFVPQEFRAIRIDGVLLPEAEVKGKLLKQGFDGDVSLKLGMRDVIALIPSLRTSLGTTNGKVEIRDIAVKQNIPESGSLQMALKTRHAEYTQYAVDDFQVEAAGDYFSIGPVSSSVTLTGMASFPSIPELKTRNMPIKVGIQAVGNHQVQEVTLKQLTVQAGELLKVQAHGSIKPLDPTNHTRRVSFSSRIEPWVDRILPLVPEKLLNGIKLEKMGGRDVLTVEGTGALNKAYLPQDLAMTAGVSFSHLRADMASPVAGGTVEDMNASVTMNYLASKGTLQGEASSAVHLKDVKQGESAHIGTVVMTLRSQFQGEVSSEYQLTRLATRDSLTLQVNDIAYHQEPSINATIPEVVVSSKTKADIFKKYYTIQELKITSDPMIELVLAGDYHQKDQQFDASVHLPYLDIKEVFSRISGKIVQDLGSGEPIGKVSGSLKVNGRVPQEDELSQFKIPLNVLAEVRLEDVRGGLAGYHLEGAQGIASVVFDAGTQPLAKVDTDVKIKNVRLAEGLPLKQVSDAVARFKVSVLDFNEVQIDPIHIGMKGASIGINGAVVGVKAFLEKKPDWSALFKKLFAQLKVSLSAELGKFQDVLGPMQIVGSGGTTVGLSVLKKEQGPLDARLRVGMEQVTLSRGDLKVVNLDGGLSLHKRLDWKNEIPPESVSSSFSPTDVLTQLRGVLGKGERLNMGLLDLGVLSISNFSTNLLFDRNALKVQNLAMNLLGGGLGGNLIVNTGEGFGLSAQIEAARLDLNQLLAVDKRIPGDSLIDATIGTSVYFEKGSGALDLSRTDLNIFVTHIGPEALDRLLVFLDPEGSNPTLVSARSQIKLANPSRVTIQLVRGFMNLEIHFSEGLLPTFKLDRIPVGKIKSVQKVTEGLPQWGLILKTMELIGATSLGIDKMGHVIVR